MRFWDHCGSGPTAATRAELGCGTILANVAEVAVALTVHAYAVRRAIPHTLRGMLACVPSIPWDGVVGGGWWVMGGEWWVW